MSQRIPSGCQCRTGPWVHSGMLTPAGGTGLIRCPESRFCLRGAQVQNGYIAVHWRNVPGTCPWVGVRVHDTRTCACGRGPWITARQIGLCTRRDGLTGPIASVECPGGCPGLLVAVVDGFIAGHPRDRDSTCPWSGVRFVDKGVHPPLLAPEHP